MNARQNAAEAERVTEAAPREDSGPRGVVATHGDGLFAENLVKRYRRRAVVADVSLRIAPGEVVGLLGPNGAGKTTSFYSSSDSCRPTAAACSSTGTRSRHFPCTCELGAGSDISRRRRPSSAV